MSHLDTQPNSPSIPIPTQVLDMAMSKMIAKPIYVAAKLGVADQLAKGPLTVDELARRTDSNAGALYRILRALASVNIFRETESRTFALTPMAEALLDVAGSVRGMILWFNDPAHDRAWEHLYYTVKTGKPAFEKAHGKATFEYLKQTPELNEIFNRAMSAHARSMHTALVDVYPFTGVKTIYDVGGGLGHLVRLVLEKYRHLKGGVTDLEHVISGARTALADLGDRCTFHVANFFESIPTGADTHILSFVLHDWSDAECATILGNCHRALPEEGRILIAENIIEAGNDPAYGKLLDIEMLVMTPGRERSRQEFTNILSSVGFQIVKVYSTRAPVSVIEAVKC